MSVSTVRHDMKCRSFLCPAGTVRTARGGGRVSQHSGGGRQADNRRGHLDRQDRFLLLFNDSPWVAGPGQRLVLIANSELKTSLDAMCETATLNKSF